MKRNIILISILMLILLSTLASAETYVGIDYVNVNELRADSYSEINVTDDFNIIANGTINSYDIVGSNIGTTTQNQLATFDDTSGDVISNSLVFADSNKLWVTGAGTSTVAGNGLITTKYIQSTGSQLMFLMNNTGKNLEWYVDNGANMITDGYAKANYFTSEVTGKYMGIDEDALEFWSNTVDTYTEHYSDNSDFYIGLDLSSETFEIGRDGFNNDDFVLNYTTGDISIANGLSVGGNDVVRTSVGSNADNQLVTFDGASGDLVQNSAVFSQGNYLWVSAGGTSLSAGNGLITTNYLIGTGSQIMYLMNNTNKGLEWYVDSSSNSIQDGYAKADYFTSEVTGKYMGLDEDSLEWWSNTVDTYTEHYSDNSDFYIGLDLSSETFEIGRDGFNNDDFVLNYTTGDISIGNNLIMDTGNISTIGYIDFDTTLTNVEHQEGRLHWDDDAGTLELDMAGGEVKQVIGAEIYVPHTKANGTDILNGQLVYISDNQGSKYIISLADNSNSSSSRGTIAMATENISSGSNGFVTAFGEVNDLDTSGEVAGDIVYLGKGGNWTTTKPTGTDKIVKVGIIGRVHATEGSILVSIEYKTNSYTHIREGDDTAVPFFNENETLDIDVANFYYDSTNNDLHVTGDIYSNGVKLESTNQSYLLNQTHQISSEAVVITAPEGAYYDGNGDASNEDYLIILPTIAHGSGTDVEIHGYIQQDGIVPSDIKFTISGHMDADGGWSGVTASTDCRSVCLNNMMTGHNTTNPVFYINSLSSSFNNPQISIDKVIVTGENATLEGWNEGWDIKIYTGFFFLIDYTNDEDVTYSHKTWNIANDGSGSTLNADLIDGLDSSVFHRTRQITSYGNYSEGVTDAGLWHGQYLTDAPYQETYFENRSSAIVIGDINGAGTFMSLLSSSSTTNALWTNTHKADWIGWTQVPVMAQDTTSVVDNSVPRFDGTTGSFFQNSTMTISDTGSVYISENLVVQDNFSLSVPVEDDLFFPVNSLKVPGTSNPEELSYTLEFDDSSVEQVYLTVQLPHKRLDESILEPHFHWRATDTNIGNVSWCVSYSCADIGSDFPAFTDSCVLDETTGSTATHLISPEIIINESLGASAICQMKLYRNATQTEDNYGADASLMQFDVHIYVDKLGEVVAGSNPYASPGPNPLPQPVPEKEDDEVYAFPITEVVDNIDTNTTAVLEV